MAWTKDERAEHFTVRDNRAAGLIRQTKSATLAESVAGVRSAPNLKSNCAQLETGNIHLANYPTGISAGHERHIKIFIFLGEGYSWRKIVRLLEEMPSSRSLSQRLVQRKILVNMSTVYRFWKPNTFRQMTFSKPHSQPVLEVIST